MLDDTLRALGAELADALRKQRDAVEALRAEVAAQGRELARLAVQPSRDAVALRAEVDAMVDARIGGIAKGWTDRAESMTEDLQLADCAARDALEMVRTLTKRVDAVEVDGDELRGLITDLTDRVDDLQEAPADLRQAVDDLTDRVDDLTDRMDKAAYALQG